MSGTDPTESGAMKLYADRPLRGLTQFLGDLIALAWIAAWVFVGMTVYHLLMKLAVPGEKMDDAGTSLAGRFDDAASKVDDLPLVKDGVAAPFQGASKAAEQLAAAGHAQVSAVHHLALLLAVVLAAMPILLVLVTYLPARVRFVRKASAGKRFVKQASPELFALRAVATQPLRRIAKVSDDPMGAIQGKDAEVIRKLAALDLRDCGLSEKHLA